MATATRRSSSFYTGYRPAPQGIRPTPATPVQQVTPRVPSASLDSPTGPNGMTVYRDGVWYPSTRARQDWWDTAGAAGLTPEQAGGIYKNWGDQAPLYAAQFGADRKATEKAQSNTDAAVSTLDRSYQSYLDRYSGAKNDAIATQQQAIAAYLNSPAQTALTQYADPNYQAVSDEFVGTQRANANRAISKQQADATAAGVALAGRRGYIGSGITPALTAAAGYRGAGDRAAIDSQLRTDQLTTNTDFRKWATGELSARDAEAARLRGELATTEGSVAPANPYAGQMASLQADRPVYMPDFTQVPTQQEVSRVLDTLGMSADEAKASMDRSYAYLQDALSRAETAEERDAITEQINMLVAFASWLGKAITPGNIIGALA